VFIKKEGGNVAHCATTVYDFLFVTSNHGIWIQRQAEFLKSKYEQVTVEMREEIGLFGMQFKMDMVNQKVILTQRDMWRKSLLHLEWTKVLQPLHLSL
jgi:hypothetical protein